MFNSDFVTLAILGIVIVATKMIVKGLQILAADKAR